MDKVIGVVIIVITALIVALSCLLIIININHYRQVNAAIPVDIRAKESFMRYEVNLSRALLLEDLMHDDICARAFRDDSFRGDLDLNQITIRNLNRWHIDERIIWHECINIIYYNIRILDPDTTNVALRNLSNQYIELGRYYHNVEELNYVFRYTYIPDLNPIYTNSIKMREVMSYFYLNFLLWLEEQNNSESEEV